MFVLSMWITANFLVGGIKNQPEFDVVHKLQVFPTVYATILRTQIWFRVAGNIASHATAFWGKDEVFPGMTGKMIGALTYFLMNSGKEQSCQCEKGIANLNTGADDETPGEMCTVYVHFRRLANVWKQESSETTMPFLFQVPSGVQKWMHALVGGCLLPISFLTGSAHSFIKLGEKT